MQKTLLFAFFILVFSTLLYAQESHSIYFKSGVIAPLDKESTYRLEGKKAASEINYQVIQFEGIPSDAEITTLRQSGIELLEYIPNNAYVASFAPNQSISKTALENAHIRAILDMPLESKMSNHLLVSSLDELPDWALNSSKNKIKLIVSFYENYPPEKVLSFVHSLDPDPKKHTQLFAYELETSVEDIKKIAATSFVSFVEPIPEPYQLELYTGLSLHRSNTLKSDFPGGRKYLGEGIGVSVGDGGKADFHTDFTGRYISRTSSGLSGHATHVMGIVGSAGILNPFNEGHAPKATLYTYNGYNDISNMATLYANDGVRITNHSLGGGCNGGYNSQARTADIQVRTYAGLLHVFSSGNSGRDNCGQYPTTYGNITGGYKAGKNVIAVGNLTSVDVLSGSSSRGPTPDGRLKPDVCAKGSSVRSTDNGDTYSTKSGTSMASPSTAGTLAQLYDAFKTIKGREPNAGEMKSILMNSAEDLGRFGPDYQYGWGRINAFKAVKIMEEDRHFISSISNGGSNNHTIPVPADVKELKVMVYWTDKEGSSSASKALVNDLDITVTTPSNQSYQPWVLNPNSVSSDATRGIDRLNNVEQVTIADPAAGTYSLDVNGYAVPYGPQEYIVVYEYIKNDITVTRPIGGEGVERGNTEYIRWDAYGTSGNFTLEYSTNNGASWNTISSSVAGTRRHYAWTTPNTITGQALVRVSRSGLSDQSDATFSIIDRPEGLKVDWICDNSFQVSWNAVTGATSYDVMMLGTNSMDSVANTSSTNFVLPTTNGAIEYVAVRARGDNGIRGMRSDGLKKSGDPFGCTGTDLSIVKIISPSNSNVSCGDNTGNSTVEVRVRNTGENPISSFMVSYQFDAETAIQQTYTTTLQSDEEITVTFTEPLTLPAGGDHNLIVTIDTDGDQVSFNNEANLSLALDPSQFVLPLFSDFDNEDQCNTATNCGATSCPLSSQWENLINAVEDDVDWRVNSGETPSANTGPTGDHTQASDDGKYLYLEASGECTGQEAFLLSPCIDLTGITGANFSLWYNMSGADMGELHIDIIENGIITTDILTPITGDQGTEWIELNASLAAFVDKQIRVRVRGITGSAYTSDISIDDIMISVSNDVGVTAILNPLQGISSCGSRTITPQYSVTNFGAETLSSFTVFHTIDGTPHPATTYTVTLEPNQSVNVSGTPIAGLSDGEHDMIAEAGQPNGKDDQNASNDATSLTFNSVSIDAPNITNSYTCSPGGTASLAALGTGGTLNWYDAPTGGNLIHQGDNYDIFVTQTTSFYVEEENENFFERVGVNDTTESPGGSHAGGFYLIFDAQKPFILKKVKVYATGAKIRTFELRSSNGTVIDQKEIFVGDGEQTITLNWYIPSGTDLQLGAATGADLYRSNSSLNYPYTVQDVVSIKHSTAASDSVGFYYYLYDWSILPLETTGALDNTFGGGGTHAGGFYLVFNSEETFLLKKATVYADGTKDRILELRNSADEIIATKTLTIVNGESTINLDLQIPKGTGMKIGFATGADLFRNNEGVSFPYQIDDLVSIYQSTATSNPVGFYYYLYNWEIERLSVECGSERIEATATVEVCTGTSASSDSQFNVYPNPAEDQLNIEYSSLSEFVEMTLIDLHGRVVYQSNKPSNNIDITELENGVYTISIKYTNKTSLKKIIKK